MIPSQQSSPMASLGLNIQFEVPEFKNVPLADHALEAPITVVGDARDAGYEELMDRLKQEPTPWGLLCEAIRCGDGDTFRRESLKFKGPSTFPPKKEAILAKRPDLLKQLLETDSSIDDDTLATACAQKDHECVRMLFEFGWPINKSLHSMASVLCGADIDARSMLDETTLSMAIAHGSMDVVRLLLSQGADISHGDLLHCAAARTNRSEGVELVEELVRRGANVKAYRHDNPIAYRWRGMSTLLTALHISCREENLPVAMALLRYGADPHQQLLNAGKRADPTPLDMALQSKNPDLVRLLDGADVVQRQIEKVADTQ
nr:putative ankyrin repeat protein [Quercus suber]